MENVVYQELASLDENDWWWFVGRRSIIRETLERHVKPRAARRVLDAGCGSGGNLPMLRRFGAVTGLEPSPIAVEAARKRCGDTVRVLQGTLPEGLPKDESFELIGLFDVLEHLEQPVPTLVALKERLTVDGQLVVTVPAFPFLWSKHDEINHHFRRYTLRTLTAELAQAGFKVDFSTHYNISLFPPIAAVRLLRKVLPGTDSDNEGSLTGGLANKVLTKTFSAERHLVSRVRFPFGVSLLVMASRA